jgi:hypothetical protein
LRSSWISDVLKTERLSVEDNTVGLIFWLLIHRKVIYCHPTDSKLGYKIYFGQRNVNEVAKWFLAILTF